MNKFYAGFCFLALSLAKSWARKAALSTGLKFLAVFWTRLWRFCGEKGRFFLQCDDLNLEIEFKSIDELNKYITENYSVSCCTYCS
jgi:hypothetical protein